MIISSGESSKIPPSYKAVFCTILFPHLWLLKRFFFSFYIPSLKFLVFSGQNMKTPSSIATFRADERVNSDLWHRHNNNNIIVQMAQCQNVSRSLVTHFNLGKTHFARAITPIFTFIILLQRESLRWVFMIFFFFADCHNILQHLKK